MTDDFNTHLYKLRDLFKTVLDGYQTAACPCAYPRFQQIVGINCSDTGDSFRCHDTELLITLSKPYFTVEASDLKDECTNEKWICKTCGSVYEYGWSDFSIHVDRQKLTLIDLHCAQIGKEATKPVPLYLGLFGHSYPPQSELRHATFEEMEQYLKEQ